MNIHSIESTSMALEENKAQMLKDKHLATTNTKEGLRKASEDFEALFLQKLLEVLNTGIGDNDMLFSQEEKLWKSMLHEEYAKSFSQGGGIGIADMIYQQLLPQVPSKEE